MNSALTRTAADDHYIGRADDMDDEYVKAFEKLSPALREAMHKIGIEGPALNDPESKQGSRDVSEWVELKAEEPDLSEDDDFLFRLSELFDIPPATAKRMLPWLWKAVEGKVRQQKGDYLGGVIGMILMEANVKVSVMGLAFALGLLELQTHRADISSMRKAAKFVGCTPSYLSQHANRWCDTLDLPRPKCMKSQAAREAYSEERKTNHWRHQVC